MLKPAESESDYAGFPYAEPVANIPSWLWISIGWAMIALGGWWVVVARAGRPSHGGRICRGCGYNMAGIPSSMCPECGRVAKSERELGTRRARKRWRLAGAALFTLGWLGTQTPAMIAYGWAAALPGWALAWWAPVDSNSWNIATATGSSYISFGGQSYLRAGSSGTGTPPSLLEQLDNSLYLETWRRMNAGELADGLAVSYLKRSMGYTTLPLAAHGGLPAAWPWDVPLPTPALLPQAAGAPVWIEARADAIHAPSDSVHVRAVVGVPPSMRTYTLGEATVPINARASRAEFMTPASSPAIDAAVLAASRPRLIVTPERMWVEVLTVNDGPEWADVPPYAAENVTVWLRGHRIGKGLLDGPTAIRGGSAFADIVWEAGMEKAARLHLDELEVELIGDAESATDMYTSGWMLERTAWVGHVRGKPQVVKRGF